MALKTNQGVFNRVVRHLLKQKKRSSNEFGNCQYINPKGLKCAIGCCIPKKYLKIFGPDVNREQEDWNEDNWSMIPDEIQQETFGPNIRMTLVGELQYLHDKLEPHYWEPKLRNLARKYGLKMPKEMR